VHALGVEEAFGLTGGAIAPLAHALAQSPLRTYHFRHECGAGYAALEASLASGRPTVLYVTTGPGITNALTAISAARWEGARVLLLSGATPPAQRQRWACQETSSLTMPLSGLFTRGPLFDVASLIEAPQELEHALQRLALGWSRPGAYLGHLSMPLAVQSGPPPKREFQRPPDAAVPTADVRTLTDVAGVLSRERCVLWVGHGARFAAAEIRALAERLGTPVMVSPRAKGIMPEDHPLYLGTTGLGGHREVEQYFSRSKPAYVLVLGSRLSEPTSFWNPLFVPTEGFIHVDLDPEVPGAAYPEARTYGIQAEIRTFLEAMLARLPSTPTRALVAMQGPPLPEPLEPRSEGHVRPQAVMAALQELVIDGSDATVMTESGNSFAWGNQLLRFREPERYRVSTGYGAMGHFATGVVGTALATGRKAFAVVGDGAMLMGTELNTAAQYGAPAVWVVLNDAQYSMVDQGMKALGLTCLDTQMPRVDFAALAKASGADGVRVESETGLHAAVRQALAAEGPFVIDVLTDNSENAPWMRRIQALISQNSEQSAPAGGVK
jgi:acetolactate synthase-1/2/3 large subunit